MTNQAAKPVPPMVGDVHRVVSRDRYRQDCVRKGRRNGRQINGVIRPPWFCGMWNGGSLDPWPEKPPDEQVVLIASVIWAICVTIT